MPSTSLAVNLGAFALLVFIILHINSVILSVEISQLVLRLLYNKAVLSEMLVTQTC